MTAYRFPIPVPLKNPKPRPCNASFKWFALVISITSDLDIAYNSPEFESSQEIESDPIWILYPYSFENMFLSLSLLFYY